MGTKNKVYATKRFQFEAAHHLPDYDGMCRNIHGHSYKLEVTVSAEKDFELVSNPTDAMVVDFSVLKHIVNAVVVKKYDHSNLNAFFCVPTAEVMVISMFHDIDSALSTQYKRFGLKLEEVKLWETEDSYATYRGEEK